MQNFKEKDLMALKNKILLLLLLLAPIVQAQVTEYEFKSAFIERFTRFVEWPQAIEDAHFDQTFKIVVVGNNPFGSSLDQLFSEVKIKGQKVRVVYTNVITHEVDAHLVFVAGSEVKKVSQIIDVIGDKPILLVSDSQGFCARGTHINLYVDGSYIRYEINEQAIKKSGLKVSSLLLASAKIVNSDE